MSSDSSQANQSTNKPYPSVIDPGTTRPTNSFSPSLIAIVVIIPVGLILLTFIYWRGRFWRKESLPGLGNQSGTRTVILLPPGGTGADLPEGQRRSDRMRRNRFVGRGRRPSRSESVRTVPE
ncbi:hypothetical protein CROQUDRAFT_149617 [Cronartium quercuum f. sp. fusiforme G11]|uniref:Uncharacterized protein n=1 Tax=Cronartium quercuum f. sp. fusiforme G11 TaxID=708437 RepID=A0A9P6NV84_9BASI|nr:hypothetical protein CROQUDRAFT_149617 [Cronartium quercuum f. sp. fusiforme G11]